MFFHHERRQLNVGGCNREAKSRWFLSSFKGQSSFQKLISSVCHRLSGHLLASYKADIYAYSYFLTDTHNWPLHQIDVKNVLINDILDNNVYMKQPPGFVAQWVCKLKKFLYKLK